MPKGRNSNPSMDQAGNWYRHSNCKDYATVGSRLSATSTGVMLNTDVETKRLIPSAPPKIFDDKAQSLYDQANPFSYHDNKHTTQLKGEYLGNGKDTRYLGRRLAGSETNQHRNDYTDFLKHHSREATDSFFQTNYMLSHDGKVPEPVANRRFPKTYAERTRGLTTPPDINAGAPATISSQTLASSLQPYAKHNSWKYTYHRHNKQDIYPKAWGDRCSVRLPQQKPRSRPLVISRVA